MGMSAPFATTPRTFSASGSTPAVPSASPFATPITAMLAPPLRLPVPAIVPAALVFTSWPAGKRPLRISSSVMVSFLDVVSEGGEGLGVHISDRFGILDPDDPPHGHSVIARTEPLLTDPQAFLFRLHRLEIKRRNLRHELLGRSAESFHGVLGKCVRPTEQPTGLAPIGAPYQRFVAGIEFLDALVRLDHLRTGNTDASLLGYRDGGTGSGGEHCPTE